MVGKAPFTKRKKNGKRSGWGITREKKIRGRVRGKKKGMGDSQAWKKSKNGRGKKNQSETIPLLQKKSWVEKAGELSITYPTDQGKHKVPLGGPQGGTKEMGFLGEKVNRKPPKASRAELGNHEKPPVRYMLRKNGFG